MFDVVIIGGGPAGFAAALYAARARLHTLILEKAAFGGQMATTNEMENYPGFEEPVYGNELAEKMANQVRKFDAEIAREEVVEVMLDGPVKTVKTTNNVYRTKTVILAMGASPRELGLPGERKLRGSGVSYCATCDGAFFRGRNVAVVGGGNTAAEDAVYLSRFCNKVFLVHRREKMRATKILQESVLGNPKIIPYWNSTVDEILGENMVEGIKIRNTETREVTTLNISGLFIAIGIVPNSELVKGKVDLNESGYIVTDEAMRTNIPGVFAAGDIREKSLRQVVTAASDGAAAADSAEKYITENNL